MCKLRFVRAFLFKYKVMLSGKAASTSKHSYPSKLCLALHKYDRVKVRWGRISREKYIDMNLALWFSLSLQLENEGIPLGISGEVKQYSPHLADWSINHDLGFNHSDNLLITLTNS